MFCKVNYKVRSLRAEIKSYGLLYFQSGTVFKDFIYLFERQRLQVGREAGRERVGSRLSAEQGARCGA